MYKVIYWVGGVKRYRDIIVNLSPVVCLCCLCSWLAICIALAEFVALSISLPNIVMLSHLVKFLFNVIVIIYIT